MDKIKFIIPLIIAALFSFNARADTPLITCNSTAQAIQTQASPPKYTCVTFGALSMLNAAPAGTLTGTTLNSTVVNSSLTGLGTISTGIWNGTPIGTAFGGLGANESAATGIVQMSGGTTSVSAALANNTTATTQAETDSSTKVATDAFVSNIGTLNSLTSATSLSSVGTITTGTWNGTAIDNAHLANPSTTVNGQTCTLGSTCTAPAALATLTGTFAQGDVAYFNGNSWVVLPPGTSGNFLKTQGASANPLWAAVPSTPPAGSTHQIQGNNGSGGFEAFSNFTNDGTNVGINYTLDFTNSVSNNPIIKWTPTTAETGLMFYSGTSEIMQLQDNGVVQVASLGTLGGMNFGNFFIQRASSQALNFGYGAPTFQFSGGGRAGDNYVEIDNAQSGNPVLVVAGAASQTGDMQDWENSGHDILANIDYSGKFINYDSSGDQLIQLGNDGSGNGSIAFYSSADADNYLLTAGDEEMVLGTSFNINGGSSQAGLSVDEENTGLPILYFDNKSGASLGNIDVQYDNPTTSAAWTINDYGDQVINASTRFNTAQIINDISGIRPRELTSWQFGGVEQASINNQGAFVAAQITDNALASGSLVKAGAGGILTSNSTNYTYQVAQIASTANAAAISATTAYAVPASLSAQYRVTFVAKVTTPATSSSTLGGSGGFQVTYTDVDDSVVVSTAALANNAGTSLSGNTTQTVYSGSVLVNAKASTNIQYSFGYTSSGATTMKYNMHVIVEKVSF